MELALIFVLELCGLALGLALARVAFAGTPSATVRRVVAALERATRSFLLRALTRVAIVGAFLAGLVAASGTLMGHASAGVAGGIGIVFGTALGSLSAFGSAWLGSRGAAAVIVGAGLRFDLALGAAVRGAGATGVVAQALAVAGALGLLGAGHWQNHASTVGAEELALAATLALPGYAFGGALAALVLQRTAGAYAAAARAGELRGVLMDVSVARHEVKNPALVSALVGERLEHAAAAARLFAASTLAAVGAILLGSGLATKGALEPRLVAYPLLLWGFGLVANGAGLFVALSLEAQGAGPALARGQLSAAAVWLVGLLGGGGWLFPDSWPALASAGVLGWLGGALAPYGMVRAFGRRRGPMRDALDTVQAGPAWAQAGALGFGLGHAGLSLALLTACGVGATRLGAASGVVGGEYLALMLALFSAMAWSPYALAVDVGASIAETARGVASMGGAEADTLGRIQRLADSSQLPAAIARAQLTLTQGLAALTTGLALAPTSLTAGACPAWIGLLGVALVLSAVGTALQRAARGARELATEVERQLGGGLAEAPGAGRAPSYRGCEELAGRVALAGAGLELASTLGGPVLLGIALRRVYRESGPRLAAEALATLVAGAAVTALGVALAVDGARAVLAGARRANRPDGDQKAHAASVTGSALAEILGSAAGPAACTAALLLASLALLARTFLP